MSLALTHNFNHRSPIQRVLNDLSGFDWDSASDEVGSYLISSIQQRFEDQITPSGRAFIQSAAAASRGGKTLLDSGSLRDSYSYEVGSGGHEITVGSNLVYAGIHHAGGMTGRGHMTEIQANPVLGISRQDEREIGHIFIAEIKQTLRSAR